MLLLALRWLVVFFPSTAVKKEGQIVVAGGLMGGHAGCKTHVEAGGQAL